MRVFIRTYQLFVSPIIGPRCRYLPTCSEYFLEALESHGVVAGTKMGMKRIVRCHPWGAHGYDPVPEPEYLPEPNCLPGRLEGSSAAKRHND